mmetsp:Transcript_934/g.2885  ORF Transcript_934/g.2885 Transcript_934/m.2885 type:complete len:214 (-) Transcript_934:1674-2315(-)
MLKELTVAGHGGGVGRGAVGEDLHHFRVVQLVGWGHKVAIDLGGNHVVAYPGVDVVGKVDNGGTLWQVHDLSGGSEYKYPLSQEVAGYCVYKLPGRDEVQKLLLPLPDGVEPINPPVHDLGVHPQVAPLATLHQYIDVLVGQADPVVDWPGRAVEVKLLGGGRECLLAVNGVIGKLAERTPVLHKGGGPALGCDAILRQLVHLLGAYLHLQGE